MGHGTDSSTSWLLAGACATLLGALAAVLPRPAVAEDARFADVTPSAAPPRADAAFDGLADRIDARIDAKIAERKLTSSPPAEDVEFLRRLSLDLTGRIPAPDSVLDFLDDRDAKKRARKIDELLASPAWAAWWADVWTILLVGRVSPVQEVPARRALREWVRGAFARNMPYDAFARALVAASGRSDENPAVFYLLRFRDAPADAAGHAMRLFRGRQIQCAQCHNHPYEKWTPRDFFGVAAFFARMRARSIDASPTGLPLVEVYDAPAGEAFIPDAPSAEPIAPRFLTGAAPDPASPRRAELARLLTAPDDAAFARAAVNRAWAQCFGRGLVEPVDDLRDDNPGTHPELLDELTRAFVAGGYDLRALLRAILNSRAYQRSSRPPPAESAEGRDFYTHAWVRHLTPEQLLESLLRATAALTIGREQPPEMVAEVKRRMLDRFVFLFADDEMREVTHFEGSIPAALLMLNGPFTNSAWFRVREREPARMGEMTPVRAPSRSGPKPEEEVPVVTTLDALFLVDLRPEDRVERLFLSILSRPPRPEERARYLAYLRKRSGLTPLEREACKDIAWALLNSTEFRFNH